jgi:TPR repeat protein
MYANGFFVKEDDAKALDWYEKSIEAGNAFGLAQAGVMYFNGKGTPVDYSMAAQYFQQAADLGDGYSLKFLALMYERGLLGKPDPAKAAELRLKAAQVDPDSQTPDVPPPRPIAKPGYRSAAGAGRYGGGGQGSYGSSNGGNQFYTGTVPVKRWHGIATRLPRCWPICSLR